MVPIHPPFPAETPRRHPAGSPWLIPLDFEKNLPCQSNLL